MADRATDTGKGYTLAGTVLEVGDVQSWPSGFTKRTIVLQTESDKYPQRVPVDFARDNMVKLDRVTIGDKAVVTFDLEANEKNGRRYINLRGWKIEKHAGGNTCDQTTAPQTNPTTDAGKQEEALPF